MQKSVLRLVGDVVGRNRVESRVDNDARVGGDPVADPTQSHSFDRHDARSGQEYRLSRIRDLGINRIHQAPIDVTDGASQDYEDGQRDQNAHEGRHRDHQDDEDAGQVLGPAEPVRVAATWVRSDMPHLRSLGRPAALGVLLTVTISAPTPAYAHGIGGDASQASVFGFIELGIVHMLTGWDHLAFIAGVLLVARSFRLCVKLTSVFVAGHSTTLIAAMLLGWQVNADYVDAAIAGSVAFVGCVGILGRPRSWGWFGAVVAAFGLIHGLGLATRFADLGLPDDGRLLKVIAFNIGIEIGQATAIFAMVAISAVLTTIGVPSPTEGRRDDAETDADLNPAFDQARNPKDSHRSREQLVISSPLRRSSSVGPLPPHSSRLMRS